MRTKYAVINKTTLTLKKAGFYVYKFLEMKQRSFDIIARRDDILVFIKVLINIDNLTLEDSQSLVKLSKSLNASALVIGEYGTYNKLQDGIMYMRFGIPIITLGTLKDFVLEGVPPFLFSSPGGIFALVDGDKLKMVIKEKNLSLGQVARALGVSRKAIQLYEHDKGARTEIIDKLEALLGVPLTKTLDPFEYGRKDMDAVSIISIPLNNQNDEIPIIFNFMRSNGIEVIEINKCPFEGIVQIDNDFITSVGTSREIKSKAMVISTISHIVEKDPIAINLDNKTIFSKKIGGIPVIPKKKLMNVKEGKEIEELFEESYKLNI